MPHERITTERLDAELHESDLLRDCNLEHDETKADLPRRELDAPTEQLPGRDRRDELRRVPLALSVLQRGLEHWRQRRRLWPVVHDPELHTDIATPRSR